MVTPSIHLFIHPSKITSFLFPSYCIVIPVSCPEAFTSSTRLLVYLFAFSFFLSLLFLLKRGVRRGVTYIHTALCDSRKKLPASGRKTGVFFPSSLLLFYPICIPFLQWFMTWCIAVSYNPSIKSDVRGGRKGRKRRGGGREGGEVKKLPLGILEYR